MKRKLTEPFETITGMDFAHVMNGYRYHTKYDHIDYLPPKVLQRTGDNILALVRRMANADELINPDVCIRVFTENGLHFRFILCG